MIIETLETVSDPPDLTSDTAVDCKARLARVWIVLGVRPGGSDTDETFDER